MTIHGAIMVLVVLVALSQTLPEGPQLLAAATRDLGFAGMGAALVRTARLSAETPGSPAIS